LIRHSNSIAFVIPAKAESSKENHPRSGQVFGFVPLRGGVFIQLDTRLRGYDVLLHSCRIKNAPTRNADSGFMGLSCVINLRQLTFLRVMFFDFSIISGHALHRGK
jgi:hypothetical protein